MRFRLAKTCDLNEIVNIHYDTREIYSVGIFAQLGKPFLRMYYKIILNDKNGIIICAEDEQGRIQGFCSGTLNVEEQFENIKKHKVELAVAAITSLIKSPRLIIPLNERYKSIRTSKIQDYVSSKGARFEYWAWSAKEKNSMASIEMHETLLIILRDFGVNEVHFEVDSTNIKIFQFHKINGAELIRNLKLPDGRERAIMKYVLKNRNSKLIS